MGEETATEREGQSKHIEREFEIGKDEAWSANLKRLFDEMLGDSLESTRRNRTYVDEVLADSRSHTQALNNLAVQSLANCVQNSNMQNGNATDTSNLLNKQAAAHRDLAIDREWNINETDALAAILIRGITGTDVFKEAVEAVAAMSVQPKEKTGA